VTRGRENPETVLVIRLPLERPARALIDASTHEDSVRLVINLAGRDLPAEVEQALAELFRVFAESDRA
jgi:hypothetical protein